MCAVAIAKFYWMRAEPIVVQGDVQVDVRYDTKEHTNVLAAYTVSQITESTDKRELSMYIMKRSGSLSCKVTVYRKSMGEDSEVELKHSEQHASDLREVFRLSKKAVANGKNFNSKKYRDFSGESNYDDRLELSCEIKVTEKKDDKVVEYFKTVPYRLFITSVNYQKAAFAKAA
jgi:hypothetical protein